MFVCGKGGGVCGGGVVCCLSVGVLVCGRGTAHSPQRPPPPPPPWPTPSIAPPGPSSRTPTAAGPRALRDGAGRRGARQRSRRAATRRRGLRADLNGVPRTLPPPISSYRPPVSQMPPVSSIIQSTAFAQKVVLVPAQKMCYQPNSLRFATDRRHRSRLYALV